jgi:hypothetical protein
MASKKSAKKQAKPLAKSQMKKTRGGFSGGIYVAAGDVNGDGRKARPGAVQVDPNNPNQPFTGGV